MASVKHHKVTAIPDDPAFDVGAGEWNAEHDVSIAHSDLTGVGAGDHHSNANDPSANEKAALAGTSGTAPSGANKLVDDADTRLTNARTPTAHHASHESGGGDPVAVTHAQTTGQTTDDHHNKSHAHSGADGSGTVAHSATTGQTADDHHAKSHVHSADGSGTVAHSSLSGLTTGDPHTQYQQESEKGAANGYASLDGSTLVPFAQLPTGTGASQVAVGNHTHAGGGLTDSLFGIVANLDPRLVTGTVAYSGVNRGRYYRAYGAATISNLCIKVGTASGNISLATYSNTGSGRSARPNSRRQTTGAVACPASGFAQVALGASDTMAQGDWVAMSCDNTTATFDRGTNIGSANAMQDGFYHTEASAHPLPATATPATPPADSVIFAIEGS